jgi:hypothetical protein
MIKNNFFIKTLAFGTIMLFVGIGIIPNISRGVNASDGEGLVACWHFDEGDKEIVNDDTDNKNNGIIHGATWTFGILGFALELDGIDDHISIPGSNSLDITGNITMEIWIYPYTKPWVAPLISKGTNSGNYGYHLAIGQYYSNGCVSFQLHSNETKTLWLDSSTPVITEQWHHIAAVRMDSVARIYIDGEISDYEPCFDSSIRTNNLSLEFGTYNDYSEFFHGIIDEVCIYNRALEPSEIYNNYQEMLNAITEYEKSKPENPDNKTSGFELIILFIAMIMVVFFSRSWSFKRY